MASQDSDQTAAGRHPFPLEALPPAARLKLARYCTAGDFHELEHPQLSVGLNGEYTPKCAVDPAILFYNILPRLGYRPQQVVIDFGVVDTELNDKSPSYNSHDGIQSVLRFLKSTASHFLGYETLESPDNTRQRTEHRNLKYELRIPMTINDLDLRVFEGGIGQIFGLLCSSPPRRNVLDIDINLKTPDEDAPGCWENESASRDFFIEVLNFPNIRLLLVIANPYDDSIPNVHDLLDHKVERINEHLINERSGRPRINPFDKLPQELMDMVFDYILSRDPTLTYSVGNVGYCPNSWTKSVDLLSVLSINAQFQDNVKQWICKRKAVIIWSDFFKGGKMAFSEISLYGFQKIFGEERVPLIKDLGILVGGDCHFRTLVPENLPADGFEEDFDLPVEETVRVLSSLGRTFQRSKRSTSNVELISSEGWVGTEVELDYDVIIWEDTLNEADLERTASTKDISQLNLSKMWFAQWPMMIPAVRCFSKLRIYDQVVQIRILLAPVYEEQDRDLVISHVKSAYLEMMDRVVTQTADALGLECLL